MITVRMTSGASEASERAAKTLKTLPRKMLRLAEQGAEHLRATDPYTDRTGNLRAGTQALLHYAEDAVIVELEMDEYYASFVQKLGYSNFDDVAETVRQEMIAGIAAMREQITGGQ